MATPTTQKARKEYECGRCGCTIKPGDQYRRVAMKIGAYNSKTMIRCSGARCYFRSSELTGSETLSQAYAIREQLEDFANGNVADEYNWKEASVDLENLKGELESLQSEVQDKISNLEDAFPNGSPSLETLQEYDDAIEEWMSEMDTGVDDMREIIGNHDGEGPLTETEINDIKSLFDNLSQSCGL